MTVTVSDETLSAFIDGELSEGDRKIIETALQSDAALAARLDRLKRPDALIAEAFGGIGDEPMPEAVMNLVKETERPAADDRTILPFAAKPTVNPPARWIAPLAASLALAIGVGVGMQLAPDHRDGDGRIAVAGAIDPASPLFAALESAPSATAVEIGAGSITPVLTFKSVNGQFCREFLVVANGIANRAVACRERGQWVTLFAALTAPPADDAPTYATASSRTGVQFDAVIDGLIESDPLDEQEENALLDHWDR